MKLRKSLSFALVVLMIGGVLAVGYQAANRQVSANQILGGPANSPWPMFRHNLNHTGLSPYNTSENLGTQKWNFTTGRWVRSSPAIGSDGTIYVGSGSPDSKLYAINPNGTEKWSFNTGEITYSSPAIGSDGTIYVGSFDNKLYAINPNGTQKWNFTTGEPVISSPAIGPDGTIYIGSYDDKLYAINPNGTQKWNFTAGESVFSSPAIGSDGTIYVGSVDKKMHAINPNGTQKWNFTTGGNVESSPAIGSDGTIYVGSNDNKLYAINPNGTQKWNFTTGHWVESSPAIGSDGTIYVGSYDNKLYAINPNGSEKWNFPTGSLVRSSPAISSDGTIYAGSYDNKLYAINPNGTQKWNFTSGGLVLSSPAIGSDGTIYIGSNDYKLYAIGKPLSKISGTVFNDVDKDGIWDIGENGIWEVNITLKDSLGNPIKYNTTWYDGSYLFDDLTAGNYTVVEINLWGWNSTTPDTVKVMLNATEHKIVNFGDWCPEGTNDPSYAVSLEMGGGEDIKANVSDNVTLTFRIENSGNVSSQLRFMTFTAAIKNNSVVEFTNYTGDYQVYRHTGTLEWSGSIEGTKTTEKHGGSAFDPNGIQSFDMLTWKLPEDVFLEGCIFSFPAPPACGYAFFNFTVHAKAQGTTSVQFFPRSTEDHHDVDVPLAQISDKTNVFQDNATGLWYPAHNSYDPWDDTLPGNGSGGHAWDQISWDVKATTSAYAKANINIFVS